VNGKQYIGRDSHNNPNYLGSGKLLQKAVSKYGIENFKKEIIEECDSIEILSEREEYWLNYYDAGNNPMFYNMHNYSSGGVSGENLSEETRQKMKESNGKENHPNWGKKLSDETRKKMSVKNKGKVLSEETKRKISDKLKGKIVTDETKEKLSKSLRSRKLSDETRKKISDANIGKILSDETKTKIGSSHRGKIVTLETKLKISEGLRQYYTSK
jgi:group I intron endonuclease